MENGKLYQRQSDGARVIALRNNEDEYELRLDNHYDAELKLIGEGGQIRVKRGNYLCWTSADGHYVVEEPAFAKSHQLYVESVPLVVPAAPVEE